MCWDLTATFLAAIVAYVRPFTKNFSAGIADQRLDVSLLKEVQKHKALHDLLCSKRHEMVAHGEWKHRETELLSMQKDSTVRRTRRPDFYAGVDISEFRELVINLHAELVDAVYPLDKAQCELRTATASRY